ncbi:uncharacterized protein DS421_1g03860 [Arachis hypogaea]|nr:uncharacterized protein DS421_1g03860 [Arachis hypogaea]
MLCCVPPKNSPKLMLLVIRLVGSDDIKLLNITHHAILVYSFRFDGFLLPPYIFNYYVVL